VDCSLNLLAVAQPNAPGLTPIHGTEAELRGIERVGRNLNMSVTAVLGNEATKERVLKEMDMCPWVHFACHGLQNREPHKSALYLGDEPLGILDIAKKEIAHAEFAFLSACQTATGDSNVTEEAVHISAGMLLAGYRGVVGTMWSIPDDNTPEMVEEFYKLMLANDKHDPRTAAQSLWEATKKMQGKMKLEQWVPFIHLGI
jgi:CHAT domain-containing protein